MLKRILLRPRRRGTTYVEALAAALILSIGMMGLINVWLFSFRVTVNTDDSAVAYSLGRFTIERIKQAGFGAAEGPNIVYYDGNCNSVTSANSRYTVTQQITSDAVSSGTAGSAGAVPTNTALRNVTVTVTLTSGGTTLFTTGTQLARSGI